LNGLLIGLEMVMRAFFVVVAFTSLSIELRNPLVRELIFSKGFDKVYLALELSFASLPLMIDAMPKPKYFIRYPIRSLSKMMIQAKEWQWIFEKKIHCQLLNIEINKPD
jgi:hypothetical protein